MKFRKNLNKFELRNNTAMPGLGKVTLSKMHDIILKSYFKGDKSYYDIAKEQSVANEAEIINSGNEVSIKANGVVAYIEINYTGDISLESLTSSSYHLFLGNNKIVILLFGIDFNLTSLFRYRGRFRLSGVTVRDCDANNIVVSISDDTLTRWNEIESTYDNYTNDWDFGYADMIARPIKVKQGRTILKEQLEHAKYSNINFNLKDKMLNTDKISNTIKEKKQNINKRGGLNVSL